MNKSQGSNRRRVIAGVSLIGLSVAFLTDAATGLMTRPFAPTQTSVAIAGFLAVVNAVLMIAAMLGLSQLLRAHADGVGLAGAIFALVGWAAGTRITTVIQLDTLLRAGVEGVPPTAIETIFKSAPALFLSMFPVGLFFPLGLITLGLALFWWRPVNRWLGLLLALGGVLFPLGRAVGIEFAINACDLVLATTFAALGQQVLARPELWDTSAERNEATMNKILPGEIQASA
ncbi:MAG: hypothetical protein QOD28_90 [Acidobacteriota bacterium]|nr:hypothetical protein [Acidobacteriota bacterium]